MSQEEPARTRPTPVKAPRILVADNDEVFREFVVQNYSTPDQPVTVATNGLAALQKLQEQEFDVLIADFVMPSIDGATLTRYLRSRESEKAPFIILVSAAAREDLEHLRESGADVCIAKAPLQQMRTYLDRALDYVRTGTPVGESVIGIEDVFSRQITRELLWRNRQLAEVFEAMSSGVVILNERGYIVGHNPAAEQLLQLDGRGLLGAGIDTILPGLPADQGEDTVERTIGSRVLLITPRTVDQPERYARVLVLHDVTEERRARSQLEKTLEHRELLFREIHHRIKNSLQTVSSFVRLQSPDDAPESEREALDSIAAQVDSIAMVHERLYQGSEFGTVDFGQFIEEIVEKLVQFMRPDGSVRAQTDVAHAQFNLKTSTPLGLAVSELVTNALRHGFSDRGGTLLVRLEDQGDSRFRLLVEDDGAGIPEGLAREPESSHGLRIVAALAEQVRGTLSIRNRTPGTGAEIAFEYR